jgi:hypothetical protein
MNKELHLFHCDLFLQTSHFDPHKLYIHLLNHTA